MADNELDRARRLLAKPDLSDEDRNRLMQAFPELSAPAPEIQAPRFLQDMAPPEPASEQAPAPAPAPPPDPAEEFTYNSLMESQRQAEVEQADYQPDNPEIRNLSKKASLYVDADPKINADTPSLNTYLHFEPTLEEVERWAKKTGNARALEDLEDKGEESETYTTYADLQWKKVRAAFAQTGEPAVRLGQLDPKSATDWFNTITGAVGNTVVPFVGGMDDAISLGIGKQLLANSANMPKAEQALVKAGVIRPLAQRFEDLQSENPVKSIAGSIVGFATPFGAGRALTGLGVKAATKATEMALPKVVKYAAIPALEGGAFGGGLGAVKKLGEESRNEDTISWGDVGVGAAADAALGGLFGTLGEGLGNLGAKGMKRLRENPTMRNILNRLELGAPEQRGGTAVIGHGGVKPHKQYAEKAGEIAESEAEAVAKGVRKNQPRSPTEEMAEGVEWDMRSEVARARNEAVKQIHAMKEPYYRATNNDPNARVSLEPVGKRIMEMIDESSPGGWEFPWSKKEMLEKVLSGMRRVVKRPRPPRLDNEKVTRWLEGERIADMAPMSKRALVGDIMEGAIIREGSEESIWRTVNPREFDQITGWLDDALNEEANKSATKTLPRQLSEIQGLLKSLRDKFPANEHSPKTSRETVMVGGEPHVVEGGLSALNARAHRMMNKTRNMAEAINLKGIDRIEPDVMSQQKAVIKRIQELGLESKSAERDVVRDLFRGRPDLLETLDAIASGRAFEDFQKAVKSQGALSPLLHPVEWSVVQLTSPHVDPVNKLLAGLRGKGPGIGAFTAARGSDYVPAAESAIQAAGEVSKATVDAVETLWRLYNEANDRGDLEDLRRKK